MRAFGRAFGLEACLACAEKGALDKERVPFTGPGKRMPVTSDLAWQLPLTRLLKAQHYATPSWVMPPAGRESVPSASMLPIPSNEDEMQQSASESDEELGFSYAFADLKQGAVIHSGSHAQVKEVRISTCRVLLMSAHRCPIPSLSRSSHCSEKAPSWSASRCVARLTVP